MLPSRGPIQVTLDDTASRITHCRPTTQVRILRRPDSKTVTTIEEDEKPFDNAQTNSAAQSQQQQQTKPQQQQFLHLNKNPSQDSNYQKRQNCQQKKLNSTWNSNKPEHAASNNKKLLKTYQERADEYAKARLRILGSAFPENEEAAILSNTCGDANKMMNLDNRSTPTSTSSYYNASTSAYASCNSSILMDEQMGRLDAKIDNCLIGDNLALGETSVFTEYNNRGDNRNFRNINNQAGLSSTGCDSNCMGSKAK